MKLRVLCVGSSPRSGSTLLGRLVGRLPRAFAVGELWDYLRDPDGSRLCGCGDPVDACEVWGTVLSTLAEEEGTIERTALGTRHRSVCRGRRFPSLASAAPLRAAAADYARYVGALFEAVREATGAELIVDTSKHPAWTALLAKTPTLDVSLVHLVRERRAVLHSELRSGVSSGAIASVLRWGGYNAAQHLLARRVPRLLVRYEDMVHHPRDELVRISSFVGRSATEDDLAFIEGDRVDLGVSHCIAGNLSRFAQGIVQLRSDDDWHERLRWWPRTAAALTGPLERAYRRRT